MLLLADILIHLYIEVLHIHLSEVNSPFALAFAVASVVALRVAWAVASERGTRYCSHVLGQANFLLYSGRLGWLLAISDTYLWTSKTLVVTLPD